jgi:hypothetical protein
MTQTFSELLQDVYDGLGHKITKGITATGGGTTSIIDTTLSDTYQDDHFINYQAFIRRDAAGAGAAPQGEIQRVSAYVASTRTLTTGTFTAAIAVGDEILLVKPSPAPLADVKRICNTAIRSLGRIYQFDTSLTTAANQTEYALPDAIRVVPNRVWIQGTTSDANDNQYYEVSSFRVEEGAEGSDWTLIIPQYSSGYKIKIEYLDTHAMLGDYDDPIAEALPYPLVVAVCAWNVARWIAADDETWQPVAQNLFQIYETERTRNPILMKNGRVQSFPQWTRYVEDEPPTI